MTNTHTTAARVEGGILGLLIGDALGVPYEFHAAEEIPAPELIEYTPPDSSIPNSPKPIHSCGPTVAFFVEGDPHRSHEAMELSPSTVPLQMHRVASDVLDDTLYRRLPLRGTPDPPPPSASYRTRLNWSDLIDFGIRRAHAGVPPGTWSDDGAQALALLASLLDCGRLDLEDLGRRFLDWYDHGVLAVDGNVFDIGVTTGHALAELRAGTAAEQAGPAGEYDNGNGSLMRVLPLALWHQGSDADLVQDAFAQSRITHGHLRAQVCCGLYCLWARSWLEESHSPREEAVQRFRDLFDLKTPVREEFEWQIRPDEDPEGSGSGYVVDSLRSARLALEQETYEDVVKAAIRLGKDTDTTACIAGGIAGLRGGPAEIPARWREHLRGAELYRPLLDRLLEHIA